MRGVYECMKLTKTEIYAIVITLVFMALAIGFRVGGNERAPFAISTQNRDIPENADRESPG